MAEYDLLVKGGTCIAVGMVFLSLGRRMTSS